MGVLLVTGTGASAGKTVVASAIAACAPGPVAVVKLAQVGLPAALVTVTRLSGVRDVHEFARYPAALAPHHAARESGLPELELAETVRRLLDLDALHDGAGGADGTVLVLGTGGLLAPFTAPDGWTLADLGAALHAPTLLVTTASPEAVNHAALTVGRLAEDGVALAGLVVTAWPADPAAAHALALDDLADLTPDRTLAGVLPAGVETGAGFPARARAALAPAFGGRFDWSALRDSLRDVPGLS